MATAEERFSLKDYLFNEEKIEKITTEISEVYSDFSGDVFKQQILDKFPELELMERVYWIRESLKEHLPDDYREAVGILLESLPSESDPTLSDDDFGSFIYSPYSYFVSEYGCTKTNLAFSLAAMKELTTRFTVEGPIRFFINAFPEETLKELQLWTKDGHYHIRRLSSEGTRPSLPWAKKIDIHFVQAIPILDALYFDETRFVTRSVANHMNDISKIDAGAATKLLKKWKKSNKQDEKEMQYIVQHSLRTLVKGGNGDALKMLGYNEPNIKIQNFKINTPEVKVGDTLEFEFEIISTAKNTQQLMIDYVLHSQKANGKTAPKTFKISKKKLKEGEVIKIQKKHPLKLMTTRKLYPGKHKVELQINGSLFGEGTFVLLE